MDDCTNTTRLASLSATEFPSRFTTLQKYRRVPLQLISADSNDPKTDRCPGFEVVL